MKKQRNCWIYGFFTSLVIVLLVTIPFLMINGIPKHLLLYAGLLLVPLGLGTLLFGWIERYSQQSSDKTKRNGN